MLIYPDSPENQFTVECISDAAVLSAALSEWLRLIEVAAEPNIFFEPTCLLPALEHLSPGNEVQCVLIWGRASQPSTAVAKQLSARVLCGLFPIALQTGLGTKRGIWLHDYAYSGTPLVRSDCLRGVLSEFLNWLLRQRIQTFRWPLISAGTPVSNELLNLVQQRHLPYCVQKNFLRAEFRPASNTESYLKRALSTSTRKELLRMNRRLQEAGALTVQAITANDCAKSWATDFLALESQGWKARSGTNMNAKASHERFFRAMLYRANERHQLIMLRLAIDDQAIAMNVGLRTADGGFYFKIAHSEAYRRFAPGRILELEFIKYLHAAPEIRWFDSCAAPNHQMIERLWDGRRLMQSFWTGSDTLMGRVGIAALTLGSTAKKLWDQHRFKSAGGA